MKKSLLTLIISSSLLLSACNDKEVQALQEKLKTAETTITQLQAELSQQSAKQAECLQSAAQKAKEEKAFPALQVTISPIFEKKERLKLDKNEFDREEAEIEYSVNIATTGVDWLDKLILAQYGENINSKEDLIKQLETHYQTSLADLKTGETPGIEQIQHIDYIGQRNNVTSFSLFNRSYLGGAHGLYATEYILIDSNKKQRMRLANVFAEGNSAKLIELLWNKYLQYSAELQGEFSGEVDPTKVETFTAKEDFAVADNFYFNDQGVNFVFAPYELGAFAEGEVELTLLWEEVNPLLNKEYQRTE